MRDQDIIVVRRNDLARFADDMNVVLSPFTNFGNAASFFNNFFTVISRLGVAKL